VLAVPNGFVAANPIVHLRVDLETTATSLRSSDGNVELSPTLGVRGDIRDLGLTLLSSADDRPANDRSVTGSAVSLGRMIFLLSAQDPDGREVRDLGAALDLVVRLTAGDVLRAPDDLPRIGLARLEEANHIWLEIPSHLSDDGVVTAAVVTPGVYALMYFPSDSRPLACLQPALDGCPVAQTTEIREAVAVGTDVHRYNLTFDTAPAHLRAWLTDLPADYDLHLIDPNGTMIAESRNELTDDDLIELDVDQPGVYALYVDVGRNEFNPGVTYTLRVDSGALDGPVAPSEIE
jgi:hypothetical protein